MPPRLKKILIWAVIIFAVYAVITAPERSADMVQTTWDIVLDGFRAVGRFFRALLE